MRKKLSAPRTILLSEFLCFRRSERATFIDVVKLESVENLAINILETVQDLWPNQGYC